MHQPSSTSEVAGSESPEPFNLLIMAGGTTGINVLLNPFAYHHRRWEVASWQPFVLTIAVVSIVSLFLWIKPAGLRYRISFIGFLLANGMLMMQFHDLPLAKFIYIVGAFAVSYAILCGLVGLPGLAIWPPPLEEAPDHRFSLKSLFISTTAITIVVAAGANLRQPGLAYLHSMIGIVGTAAIGVAIAMSMMAKRQRAVWASVSIVLALIILAASALVRCIEPESWAMAVREGGFLLSRYWLPELLFLMVYAMVMTAATFMIEIELQGKRRAQRSAMSRGKMLAEARLKGFDHSAQDAVQRTGDAGCHATGQHAAQHRS